MGCDICLGIYKNEEGYCPVCGDGDTLKLEDDFCESD